MLRKITYILFIFFILKVDLVAAEIISDSQIKELYNAVIKIHVNTKDKDPKSYNSSGTAFLIDKKGHLITNFHVIKDAKLISASLNNDIPIKPAEINIVDIDIKSDIALLKITNQKKINNLPVLKVSDSNEIRWDDFIYIGYPYGKILFPSGIQNLSGITKLVEIMPNRKIPAQHDKQYNPKVLIFTHSLEPGASGSPLISMETGEVIGVATGAVIDDIKKSFAMPSQLLKRLIQKSRNTKATPTGSFFASLEFDKTDAYYQFYTNGSGNIYITGFVYDKTRGPLKNIKIIAQDLSGTHKNASTKSRHDGTYELLLPHDEKYHWQITTEHKMYIKDTVTLPRAPHSSTERHILSFTPNFSHASDVFYANPVFIDTVKNKHTSLIAKSWDNSRSQFIRVKKDWHLCTKATGCEDEYLPPTWLTISPAEGSTKIIDTSGLIQPAEQGSIDFIITANKPQLNKQKIIQFKTVNTQDDQYAQVFLNDKQTRRSFMLHGFLYTADGGVPTSGDISVIVNDSNGKTINKSGTIGKDGYFFIEIPNHYNDKNISLSLHSNIWRLAADYTNYNHSNNIKIHYKVVAND